MISILLTERNHLLPHQWKDYLAKRGVISAPSPTQSKFYPHASKRHYLLEEKRGTHPPRYRSIDESTAHLLLQRWKKGLFARCQWRSQGISTRREVIECEADGVKKEHYFHWYFERNATTQSLVQFEFAEMRKLGFFRMRRRDHVLSKERQLEIFVSWIRLISHLCDFWEDFDP